MVYAIDNDTERVLEHILATSGLVTDRDALEVAALVALTASGVRDWREGDAVFVGTRADWQMVYGSRATAEARPRRALPYVEQAVQA